MAKPKQTKTDKVRALLAGPHGTTVPAICKATGWQAHSVHAVLSGLRKNGHVIDRQPAKAGKASIYRITASPETKA